MVNKAVVGVIGVILIATLGIGALVGLEGGGSPADEANTNDGTEGTSGPEAGTDEATATEMPANEYTPIPGRQFDEAAVAANLTERVNEWRGAEGLPTLRADGTTAQRLGDMAMEHSVAMADEGSITHTIAGNDSEARYEAHDLFDACSYKPPDADYVETAEADEFEALAGTVAGESYDTADGTAFNGNESAVANALLETLQDDEESTRKLLESGLGKVGVGVEVTQAGDVYATVNVCGE